MVYLPAAVTVGYLREPDAELPLPADESARRTNRLLAATDRPHTWQRRPTTLLQTTTSPPPQSLSNVRVCR